MRGIRNRIMFKSIMAIIVPLVILMVVVSALGYRSFTDGMMTIYEEDAIRIAETASTRVDADRLDGLSAGSETTEEYRETWNWLDSLCNSAKATFVYVIRPDRTDYGHITFLYSTINHESSYTVYDYGYVRETTNDDYRAKYRALYEEGSSAEIVIRDKGWIETDSHITAMIPLKGADGQTKGILCVQRQLEHISRVRNRFIQIVLVVTVLLTAVIIIGQHIYMTKVMIYPIKQITDEAARFAVREKPAAQKLSERVKNRDEIGMLAKSIDRMEEQIVSYMNKLTQATAEKERINTELSLAKRIQADMLPSLFPPFPDRTEFDIFASMNPAKEVGGDFYDFFLVDPDHLALVMADVSGKGVPAALFMMAAKIMIQNVTLTGAGPGQILETVNNRICQGNREEMFVTVWLGILDVRTGLLKAANAGHEYPAVTGADGRFELLKDSHGFVIGGMEGTRYREYELQMKPGEKLFLYTDGVPEANGAGQAFYGTERMISTLNTCASAGPRETLETLRADVNRFAGEEPQFDDMTMLCLKYNGTARAEE